MYVNVKCSIKPHLFGLLSQSLVKIEMRAEQKRDEALILKIWPDGYNRQKSKWIKTHE